MYTFPIQKQDKEPHTTARFILSVQVKSSCGGFFSHHSQGVIRTQRRDGSLRENGHTGNSSGGNTQPSVRRLLSSTSSYTSSITPEERELREVAMT